MLQATLTFLLGLVGAVLAFAGQTGDAQQNLCLGVADVAWRSGILAVCWWAGAWGLGIGLTKLAIGPSVRVISRAALGGRADGSDRTGLDELAIALGLGGAALLTLDAVLGTVGVLRAAGGVLAWLLIAVGVVVGARVLRDAPIRFDEHEEDGPRWLAAIRSATLGLATGLLVVAASVAPGWLWSSEFAGYDALSYHLTLPKQWFLDGAVAPVEGNVYSALPSFVESAFLHLMVLRGNPIEGAYACQWWSMLATLASAFVVARIAARAIAPSAGCLAGIVFVATPWTTVVGTLAYNDMFPVLALAAGWLLVGPRPSRDRRLDARMAAALALLAAAAFGAKPSSVLFTALPMCAVAWTAGREEGGLRNLRFAPLVVAVGLAVLAPWWVRNQMHYGSATFPFLPGILGLGPWSADQMAVFQRAHGNPDGLLAVLPLAWSQWIGYGIGEPGFPLWGLLPILGLVGIAAVREPGDDGRRWWAWTSVAMLALMLLGWMLATHVKSRFLLPSAVPLCVGAAALLAFVARRVGIKVATGLACASMLLPIGAFLREPVSGSTERRAPALLVNGTAQVTGAALAEALPQLPPESQQQFIQQAQSGFVLNYTLPNDARLVGIGFATPFYILRPIAWSTVWDRGPFDRVVEAAPGTPAAWGVRLRAEGFTHAVVNPVMLSVWARSGWLNTAIGSEEMFRQFLQSNTLYARTSDGILILELGTRSAQGTAGVSGTATPPPSPAAGG